MYRRHAAPLSPGILWQAPRQKVFTRLQTIQLNKLKALLQHSIDSPECHLRRSSVVLEDYHPHGHTHERVRYTTGHSKLSFRILIKRPWWSCASDNNSTRRTPLVPVNIDLRTRSGSLIRVGHKQIKSRLNPAQIVTNSHLNNDRVRGVTVSQNVAN